MMDVVKYTKGGIWWANLGSQPQGITDGKHMVIIMSSVSNPNGTCTISVLPVSTCKSATEHRKKQEFYLVPIKVYKPCFVCCNQIRTILTSNIFEYVGQVTDSKIHDIEEELVRYLQLPYSHTTNETSQKKLEEKMNNIENQYSPAYEDVPDVITSVTDHPNISVKKSDVTITAKKRKNFKCSSRAVRCITTGELFKNTKDAASKLHISRESVRLSIVENRTTKGLKFMYSDEGDTVAESEIVNANIK